MRRTALAVAASFLLGVLSHAAYAANPPKIEDGLTYLRYALNALKRAEVKDTAAAASRDQAVQLTEKAIEEVNKAIKANAGK
jgi:hypothetical protein